ncbi:MAG: hypothetical protein WCY62_03655, partial [Clostridia bacterium]
GINILIGFSCTHFRWSFYRYWDQINACIGKIVKACKKYGIMYIEHHSSHLTFNPLIEEDYTFMNSMMEKRGSSVSDWPHMTEDATNDFSVNGKMISTFRQISGRSGKWGITNYRGYGMCFNNPDYRKAYTDYLASLYALGIDGIMTDDIQYFGNDRMGWKAFNACTCEHCRRLFREKTGYEIPQPDKWEDFYWNFKDPVFVAWKRFKDESTLDFVYYIKAHYEKLGYKPYRPNYISAIIDTNKTACPFEKCSDIWDCVFQENGTGCVIKESYLSFALEALHRYNMARKNKVPSMSMFYPCTQDAVYFTWALSKSWGQLYSNCSGEGATVEIDEKTVRAFETKHISSYTAPVKITDLAFLFSFDTRDYSDGCETHQADFSRWLEASYLSGIATDMMFENAGYKEFEKHKRIVCAHTVMLSDTVLKKLKKYVKLGGHLITIGDFAKYKPDGSLRKKVPFGQISEVLGEGRITYLRDDQCHDKYHWSILIHRFSSDLEKEFKDAPEYSVEKLRSTGGKALLDAIAYDTTVKVESRQDLFHSLFKVKKGYVLHIVNVQDTISKEGKVNHMLPIPYFIEGAKPIGSEIKVSIKMDTPVTKVTLYSPERKRALNIPFNMDTETHNGSTGNTLFFVIPKKVFAGYALVEIK